MLLAVASALGLVGCSLQNLVGPPTIKGLKLGMNIDEAVAIVNRDLPDARGHVFQVKSYEDFSTGKPGYRIDNEYIYQMQIEADSDKRVRKIIFGPQVLNTHFGADDMTAEELAQTVIDNYGIPVLEPFEGGWEYRDPDQGYILAVGGSSKFIKLESIAKKSEQNFN